jgi:hypothetical protein
LGAVAHGRIPDDLAITSVEGHQVRFGGGHENLIAVDSDTAHRRRGQLGPVAILPNELAGPSVQGLQHHTVVVPIKHPVVNDGRGLISKDGAVLHGPTPHLPQVVYVLRSNLIQRAEGTGLVIASDHQPIRRDPITQPGIGYGNVVLDLACDANSAERLWFLPRLTRVAQGGSHRRGSTARLQVRRALTGCDASNSHVRGGRKNLVPAPCAVGIQDECREAKIRIARKRGSARRHSGLHILDQLARGSGAPLGREVGSGQLRPFPPGEIGCMTRGTIGLINCPSCRGLVLRIWPSERCYANKITIPQAPAAMAIIIRNFIMPPSLSNYTTPCRSCSGTITRRISTPRGIPVIVV